MGGPEGGMSGAGGGRLGGMAGPDGGMTGGCGGRGGPEGGMKASLGGSGGVSSTGSSSNRVEFVENSVVVALLSVNESRVYRRLHINVICIGDWHLIKGIETFTMFCPK